MMKRCGIDISGNCSQYGDFISEQLCKYNGKKCAFTLSDKHFVGSLRLFFTQAVQNELFRLRRTSRLEVIKTNKESDMNLMMRYIINKAYAFEPKIDKFKVKTIRRDSRNPKKKIKVNVDTKILEQKAIERKRKMRESIISQFIHFPTEIKRMILQTYKNYIMRLDLFVISGIFDYVAQSLSQRKLPIQINPYLRQDNRALRTFTKIIRTVICIPLHKRIHELRNINTSVLNKFKGFYHRFDTQIIKNILEHARMRNCLVSEGLYQAVRDVNHILFYTSPFLTRASHLGRERKMTDEVLKKYLQTYK